MFGLSLTLSETNAISVLERDHRKVESLFAEFGKQSGAQARIRIATQICHELAVHARVEEELLYPQALDALGEQDRQLIWEATVEHGTLSGLIAALGGMSADDESFDAHIKVLEEYVKHHVKEEEYDIFPKIRRTDLDLEVLGAAITDRKMTLKREMASSSAPRARRAASRATASAR